MDQLNSIAQVVYPEKRVIMEVGDIIVPSTPGYGLRSGGSDYGIAIIVQVEPPVAVSLETDMRWSSTIDRENFAAVGKAKQEIIDKCMRRLEC